MAECNPEAEAAGRSHAEIAQLFERMLGRAQEQKRGTVRAVVLLRFQGVSYLEMMIGTTSVDSVEYQGMLAAAARVGDAGCVYWLPNDEENANA